METDQLTVLVVDDNDDLRELYSLWLGETHTVRMAPDGSDGLEKLDGNVDIVFLDRKMPGLSGTDIAQRIEAGPHDPHVVMVSSLDAEFDIVDVPIDEYVQKPVDESQLQDVVDQFLVQQSYQSTLDEYFSLTAKLAMLEAQQSREQLAHSDEYEQLKEAVAEKRAEVDDAISTAETDWSAAFTNCTDDDETQIQFTES